MPKTQHMWNMKGSPVGFKNWGEKSAKYVYIPKEIQVVSKVRKN